MHVLVARVGDDVLVMMSAVVLIEWWWGGDMGGLVSCGEDELWSCLPGHGWHAWASASVYVSKQARRSATGMMASVLVGPRKGEGEWEGGRVRSCRVRIAKRSRVNAYAAALVACPASTA